MITLIRPEITPTGAIESDCKPTVRVAGTEHDGIDVVHREVLAPSSELPTRLLFGAPIHPTLRLRRPISLKVRRDDDGAFTVDSEELEEFGTGTTLGDALVDFGKTIADLYFNLERDHSRLGPDLVRIHAVLHEHVSAR